MAIINNDIKFLFYCKRLGVSFENLLTLGRLQYYGTAEHLKHQAEYFKGNTRGIDQIQFNDGFAEPFFKILGAASIDSIDYSDYQKATIIHDLNKPIAASLYNKFSCVLDSGTMEHIFNFPVAIENCMKAVKTGGHFIGITPANNLMGHGFYQFSPELFFNVFSPANGFEIVKMIIAAGNDQGEYNKWYEVINPATVGERVIIKNSFPTQLMFIAKKTKETAVFNTFPQQSDYVEAWARSSTGSSNENKASGNNGLLKKVFYTLPLKFQQVILAVNKELKNKPVATNDLGVINSRHFKELDV